MFNALIHDFYSFYFALPSVCSNEDDYNMFIMIIIVFQHAWILWHTWRKGKESLILGGKERKVVIIVLPGLIGHRYAKFAPWYENKIDFAILKSTEFDLKSTKFAEPKDVPTDESYFGEFREMYGRTKVISGKCGRTDRKFRRFRVRFEKNQPDFW